jgi:hypothetical protein
VYLSIRASRLTGLSGAVGPFGDEPLARQRGGSPPAAVATPGLRCTPRPRRPIGANRPVGEGIAPTRLSDIRFSAGRERARLRAEYPLLRKTRSDSHERQAAGWHTGLFD